MEEIIKFLDKVLEALRTESKFKGDFKGHKVIVTNYNDQFAFYVDNHVVRDIPRVELVEMYLKQALSEIVLGKKVMDSNPITQWLVDNKVPFVERVMDSKGARTLILFPHTVNEAWLNLRRVKDEELSMRAKDFWEATQDTTKRLNKVKETLFKGADQAITVDYGNLGSVTVSFSDIDKEAKTCKVELVSNLTKEVDLKSFEEELPIGDAFSKVIKALQSAASKLYNKADSWNCEGQSTKFQRLEDSSTATQVLNVVKSYVYSVKTVQI